MFWNKKSNNKNKEIYNSVNEELTKNKNKEIYNSINEELTKVKEKLSRLERIIQYGKPGKITYYSYDPYEDYMIISLLSESDRKITNIYKDNFEYQFKGLLLHNAEIDQNGLRDGVIHIVDKYKEENEEVQVDYLVDLNNKIFIRES